MIKGCPCCGIDVGYMLKGYILKQHIVDKINQLESCIGQDHYKVTVKVLKDLIK